MELRQLRTFRVVAGKLSFTKAAKQLFMAQSSVSAQIRTLEEELGVKLFDRIGRQVMITDAGQKLFEYARRIESMTEEIVSEVTGRPNTRGALTIRIPETIASIYLPEIVDRFHRHYPYVKLNCINCADHMLKEELNSGRIDLAFLMTDGITFKDVNVRMLKAEELILVAGPKHPFCLKEKIVLEDLQKQTLLIPKTDCSYRKAFERSLEKQGIVPRILYFSSIIGLRNCLKKGIGLTLCPKIAVNSELKRGRLVELSWDVKSIETSVLMIWHTEKWCSPLLSQFMYFAEEVITP